MSDTTNPSPVYCFGEILWDHLPEGALPGGAPFNVACHLRRLNHPCSMISRVGNDAPGRTLKDLMRSWGVNNDLLQTDPEHITGQVLATMDQHHEMSYDIRFPVAWDFITATPEALEQVSRASYFIYGSLSARHAPSRTALFQFLDRAPFKVLDINLRPPFYEKELLKKLLLHAHVLKTNQHELRILMELFDEGTAWPANQDADAIQVRLIQERFDIPLVIVTKGAAGAACYTEEGNWHVPGTPVKVTDTIGSGDAFLAAFIVSHAQKHPPLLSLRRAAAMGAFIAGKKGGCPEYHRTEYEEFVKDK